MSKAVLAKENILTNPILDELVKRFEEMTFFIPSPDLTKEIMSRLHYLETGNEFILPENNQALEIQRRIISEQLYTYLANISRKERARKEESLELKEVVNYNFDKAIGLDYEIEDKNLLDKISDEFILWLKERGGGFETGWGTIELVSEGRIKISRNSEDLEIFDLTDTQKKTFRPFRSNRQ